MTPLELSETIGAIYDCALEPGRWPQTLQRVGSLSGAGFNFVYAHDVERNQPGRVFQHGGDVAWLHQYCVTYALINPLPVATWLRPIGEVYTPAALFSHQEWFESRFYQEFIKPAGMGDLIGLMGLRSGNRAVWFCATRVGDARDFSRADINTFRLLSPHVCRTIKISHALDLRTLRSEALEAALDALSAGVFLIDGNGRVVHANRAAEVQASSGAAVRIANNRLAPTNKSASDMLSVALARDARGRDPTLANMHSIAMPAKESEGLIATILPIDGGPREDLLAPWSARWAVFVQNPTVAPQIPGEAFARLYGLTGGELRTVLAVAPGLGAKEAADILGLSEATVRTHLQRAFDKTGTTRQTELIKLIMASSPPVDSDGVDHPGRGRPQRRW